MRESVRVRVRETERWWQGTTEDEPERVLFLFLPKNSIRVFFVWLGQQKGYTHPGTIIFSLLNHENYYTNASGRDQCVVIFLASVLEETHLFPD